MNKLSTRDVMLPAFLSFMPLLLVVTVNLSTKIEVIKFTRDMQTLGHVPFYYGLISNFGIVLWAICASICFFVGFALRPYEDKKVIRYLFSSGAISTYLFLDDLLLVHEQAARIVRGGEKLVFVFIGLFVFVHLYSFRQFLIRNHPVTLFFAILFLSISVGVDQLQPYFWEKGDWHAIAEDGSKWIGIVFWCWYHALFSFGRIRSKLEGSYETGNR